MITSLKIVYAVHGGSAAEDNLWLAWRAWSDGST
jgi:hypothetical protein